MRQVRPHIDTHDSNVRLSWVDRVLRCTFSAADQTDASSCCRYTRCSRTDCVFWSFRSSALPEHAICVHSLSNLLLAPSDDPLCGVRRWYSARTLDQPAFVSQGSGLPHSGHTGSRKHGGESLLAARTGTSNHVYCRLHTLIGLYGV